MAKRGQPTKYKKEYCKLLIDHMSQGYSFESFAGLIRVNQDTIHEWCKHHREFSEAKAAGVAASRLVWEKIFMAGTTGKLKGFNAAACIFNFKNRFGWRDHVQVTDTSDVKKIEVSYKIE